MKIYLAVWFDEAGQGEALTKKGKKERLVSYYYTANNYTANNTKVDFQNYVLTGKTSKKLVEAHEDISGIYSSM